MFILNIFSSSKKSYFSKIFDIKFDLDCSITPKRLLNTLED
jgi:hypothetical protein